MRFSRGSNTGEDLTAAVREAWTVCHDELADEMKAASGSNYTLRW
jgi:hypothetical protein